MEEGPCMLGTPYGSQLSCAHREDGLSELGDEWFADPNAITGGFSGDTAE